MKNVLRLCAIFILVSSCLAVIFEMVTIYNNREVKERVFKLLENYKNGIVKEKKLELFEIYNKSEGKENESKIGIQTISAKRSCNILRGEIGTMRSASVAANVTAPDWSELENLSKFVSPGGRHVPESCVSDTNIALIIPYRNRDSQLRTLLKHIHPFLQKQRLSYQVFIIEMDAKITFNRGLLFNVGFLEAMKVNSFDCFILHDVDLLAEDYRNNYTCANMPVHLSAAISKFGYRMPYAGYAGGVLAMRAEHFKRVNGFPNLYFGWGGEDDDMAIRIYNKHMKIIRYPKIARYRMIQHGRDQPANRRAGSMVHSAKQRMASDGLNSIHYQVLRTEYRPLYTWILVTVNETKFRN